MLITGRNDGLDRWFDDFFERDRYKADTRQPAAMETDILEQEDIYMIEISLPGYKKEQVRAQLKDGYLTVRAFGDADGRTESGRYILRERYTGNCQRSFYVGDWLRHEDIRAAFENGVLRLAVPKTERKRPENEPSRIHID